MVSHLINTVKSSKEKIGFEMIMASLNYLDEDNEEGEGAETSDERMSYSV
jgi:hypothetical protein